MNPPTPLTPWLAQLRQERPHFHLEKETECDVAVIGAGIAGVSTTYAILTTTNLRVALIDAGRIAHGATGRNAGQIVSYFERPFPDIVREFGKEMAVAGQNSIESAWGILEDICQKAGLSAPLYRCKGYAGFSTIEQVITHLEEHHIRAEAGLIDEQLMIKVDTALLKQIPQNYHKYLLPVPHSVLLGLLNTDDSSFFAVKVSDKGCMNSALFCEELVAWMVKTYGDRLTVAERLPVERIILERDKALLKTTGPDIKTSRVVLCTNGFENFAIENRAGEDIDKGFHMSVLGRIGYMAGYLDENETSATAISYYRKNTIDPYDYLTRRPFDHGGKMHSLLCIGGPERRLPDCATYDSLTRFPADIEEKLDQGLRTTYRDLPPTATRSFLWQGLMGYTNTGLRRIGYEPKNPVLLYNLGCNGVGILPSVYGGKRIAMLLSGIHLAPSIFDPDKGNIWSTPW